MKRLTPVLGALLCAVSILGIMGCGGPSDTSSSTTDKNSSGTTLVDGSGAAAQGEWAKLRAVGQLPPGRAFATMVYDPLAHRVIVFGGGTETVDLADTWAYEPATGRWTDLGPTGTSPSARELAPMVYDPVGKKLYLFGGWDQTAEKDLGDTWCYDPTANTWTQLDPGKEKPSGRDGHSLIYDAKGKRIILFGGSDQEGVELSDTWTYDPAANKWTELKPSGPLPVGRAWHSVAYDSSARRMIVFGGCYGDEGSETYLNDTWSYDLATNSWANLDPGGDLPGRCYNAAMAYDPSSRVVFLYGGAAASGAFRETWAYDTVSNTWIELQPPTSPGAGLGHAMVYDSDTGQILLFGGVDLSDGAAVNEMWAYHPAATLPTLGGGMAAAPPARGGACAVYDPVGKKVILFGGNRFSYDDTVPTIDLHDTWAFDPVTTEWRELRPAGDLPPGRSSHAMVYDPVSKRIIMFGGYADTAGFNDTWSYDPVTNKWAELSPAGGRPAPRDGHTMVYDPVGRKIIMFGGSGGSSVLSETWAYDPAANKWTELHPRGEAPGARGYHTMFYDPAGKRMILLGGNIDPGADETVDAALDEFWTYDPKADTWGRMDAAGGDAPSSRFLFCTAYDEVAKQLVLFGGSDSESFQDLSETWRFDPAKKSWAEFVPEDAVPKGREGQAMVYDPVNGKIIMFGGLRYSSSQSDFEFFNDTWAYDCAKNTWTELIPTTSDAIQASRTIPPRS